MAEAVLKGPDGTALGTLRFPDGTPPEVVRQKALEAKTKYLGAIHTTPSPAQAPVVPPAAAEPSPAAPEEPLPSLTGPIFVHRPAPAPLGTSGTDAAIGKLKGYLESLSYRGPLTTMAGWNALAYDLGMPPTKLGAHGLTLGISPAEFKKQAMEAKLPYAESLNDQPLRSMKTVGGVLDHLGAVMAPAEMLSPAYWGGLSLIGQATNQRTADIVGMVAGLTQTAREGVRGIRYLRGRTPNEIAGIAAREEAAASKIAEEGATLTHEHVLEAHQALEAHLNAELSKAQAVAATAETAAVERVAQARIVHQARIDQLEQAKAAMPSTAAAAESLLGVLPGAPDKQQIGAMMQAVGGNVRNLAPEGAGEVGVSAAMRRVDAKATSMFQTLRKLSQDPEKPVVLPGIGQGILDIREHAARLNEQAGGRLTGQAKRIVQQFMHLGEAGDLNPVTDDWEPVRQAMAEAKAMREGAAVPMKAAPVYADVPYADLSLKHAELANMSVSPQDFPGATNFVKKSLRDLKNTVDSQLRILEAPHPEMRELGSQARNYVRDVQMPLKRVAGKVLKKATEEEAANTLNDAGFVRRYFDTASGEQERNALRDAWMRSKVEMFTRKDGSFDHAGFLKHMNSNKEVPPSLWARMASGSNAQAKMAVDGMLAQHNTIEAQRLAVQESQAALKAAQTEAEVVARRSEQLVAGQRQAAGDFLDASKAELKRAEAAMKDAMAAAKKSADEWDKAGRRVIGKNPKVLEPQNKTQWGLVQLARAVLGTVAGQGASPFTISHYGMAWLYLRNPTLVKQALETPIDAPNARLLAVGIHQLLQGYHARALNQQDMARRAMPAH